MMVRKQGTRARWIFSFIVRVQTIAMAVGKVVLAVEDEHGSREVGCRLHTTQAEILPNRHRGLHVLGELEKSRIKARVSEKEELDELMGNGDLNG
jgi:hypothetical protein